jgi:16S rRNA processing protein RimM
MGWTPTSTSSTPEPGADLLQVGRVVKAHGLRGEVVIELVSNRPERTAAGATLVVSAPSGPRSLTAGSAEERGRPASSVAGGSAVPSTEGTRVVPPERRSVVVESARPLPATGRAEVARFLVRLQGVTDRVAAEALRGAELWAEPIADEDVLWVHALVGCEVVDADGRLLGQVGAVLANPASDLLELTTGALIPLCFVTNHRPGRVEVDIPPGLVD